MGCFKMTISLCVNYTLTKNIPVGQVLCYTLSTHYVI